MVFTEHLADVGNGHIEYLDTGAPTNQENYNTFLFIPGAGHTAHCYDRILDCVPTGVRAIAMSQRGVGKSSELSPDEMRGNVPPRKLYDLHVLDIQNLLQYMRNELKISRLTITVWSASCSAILGLFTLEHLPVTQTFFPFVERIVLWEPPTPIVLDMPRTATGIAHRVVGEFPAHVALFISNPPDYLADRIVGKYTQVFPSEGSTLNDPDYPSWSKTAMDLHSWPANFRALISNDRAEMKDKVREACHNLAHANVQKGVLYGTKALPDCIEGCWVVRDWIEEVGGQCTVTAMEGVNHFAQFHDPKLFWKSIE